MSDAADGLYIGLMSGTSLDGVDGVLVNFGAAGSAASRPVLPLRILAHEHRVFPTALSQELLALNTPGDNELHRAALAGNALARIFAETVAAVCAMAGVGPRQVRAIGAHGQTVRHRPGEFDATGYTLQLNSPALLAELSGIDVVADLRSRDVAAGGQGAPLVPAFHRAVFGLAEQSVAVLNVGGIANLTAFHADGNLLGFDCGPGNMLMDHWCRAHTGHAFDAGGAWGATGQVDAALLSVWLNEPYFSVTPPKSTGRDLFNAAWLARSLASHGSVVAAADVQATLVELTAITCAEAVQRHGSDTKELLVCGGGGFNTFLMSRLAARLPGIRVVTTNARGLPPDQVEACAFAWLARALVANECGSLSSVTGAKGPRVLGALYPAGPTSGIVP